MPHFQCWIRKIYGLQHFATRDLGNWRIFHPGLASKFWLYHSRFLNSNPTQPYFYILYARIPKPYHPLDPRILWEEDKWLICCPNATSYLLKTCCSTPTHLKLSYMNKSQLSTNRLCEIIGQNYPVFKECNHPLTSHTNYFHQKK